MLFRRKLLVLAAMNSKQLYRMRAPASGREAIAPAEPGQIYRDRETGEEMFPVAKVLPLAPSSSSLPRSPENLRACRRCDQLIGIDVSRLPVLRASPRRALSASYSAVVVSGAASVSAAFGFLTSVAV